MLDQNKDKKVCEKDLFDILNNIQDNEIHRILHNDILVVFKSIKQFRDEQGKNDTVKIKLDRVERNVGMAIRENKIIEKEDH